MTDAAIRHLERQFYDLPTEEDYRALIALYKRRGLDFKHILRQQIADLIGDCARPKQLEAGGIATIISEPHYITYSRELSDAWLTISNFVSFRISLAGAKMAHTNDWHHIEAAPERFEMETVGYWSTIQRCRAMAVDSNNYAFGVRSLQRPRSSGYELEGRVSIKGRTHRAFTSSILFARPSDGGLVDRAVLHVCTPHTLL